MKLFKPFLLALAIALPALSAAGASAGVTFTTLMEFRQNLNDPIGYSPFGLIKGSDGNIYGTTIDDPPAQVGGGYVFGAVFKITPDGALTAVAYFTDSSGAYNTVTQGADGQIYGTTSAGGSGYSGTVFQVTTNGLIDTLLSFGSYSTSCDCTPDGISPMAPLVQGNDGNFYGTANQGGSGASHTFGVVFCVATNGAYTNLVSFTGANGADPWFSGLVLGADGNFYGTTRLGGATYNPSANNLGDGTIFRVATNGTFTTLVSFNGANGQEPFSGVVLGKDGNLYGTTSQGGQSGYGTVFQLQVSGPLVNLNVMHSFTSPEGAEGTNTDGYGPVGALLVGIDGNLYGTASGGGAYGWGTIFQMQTNGTFTTLYSFTGGSDGGNPESALVQGNDGNFYSATYTGGSATPDPAGTIFRLSIGPSPPVFETVTQTNGTLTLTWSAVAGQKYQLEYAASLAGTNWTNLGSAITATNSTGTASDTIGPGLQRFYRLLLLP